MINAMQESLVQLDAMHDAGEITDDAHAKIVKMVQDVAYSEFARGAGTNRCPARNPRGFPAADQCTKAMSDHTQHVDQSGHIW